MTVSLSNIAATDGSTGGSASVRVGFLMGDVNQSRIVTVTDLGLINSRLAQAVSATTFMYDANASGTQTLANMGIANANLTSSLPAP